MLEFLEGVERIDGERVLNAHDGSFTAADIDENCIFVVPSKNFIGFDLQKGPIKENGKNGCQVTALIEAARIIIEKLNEKYPCLENDCTLIKLDEALMWQEKRTKDREARGVEGTSQK